jgi:hypothetical protein
MEVGSVERKGEWEVESKGSIYAVRQRLAAYKVERGQGGRDWEV